jgi:hypothetical protein
MHGEYSTLTCQMNWIEYHFHNLNQEAGFLTMVRLGKLSYQLNIFKKQTVEISHYKPDCLRIIMWNWVFTE